MSIMIERCRSNSTPTFYFAPTIVDQFVVETEEEAQEILARPMANRFFYRRVDAGKE